MSEIPSTLELILKEAKELEVKGEYSRADNRLSFVINESQEYKDSNFLADALNHGGIIKRMLMQYDKALEYYQEAFELNPNNEQKAFAKTNEADALRVGKKDFARAHSRLDEALTYSENGSLMHAKAVDQRGLVFLAQKEYGSAIKSYQRAIDICKDLMTNNPNKEIKSRFGQAVHHLGVAYIKLNKPKKVKEAYESQKSALTVFKELGDQQGIINSVSALGQIAMIKNKPDESIKQYEEAWKILEKTGYERGTTALALNLAEVYLTKKQPEKARPYLEHFCNGINKITEHDINLMQDKFNKVLEMYDSCGLKINGFKKCLLNYN